MKVLHTNFLRGWGGQSNRILTECIGLKNLGWDVLLSVPPESKLAERSREANLPVNDTVRYVGGLRLGVINDARALHRIIKEYQPDIVHLHGGRDSWAYAKAISFIPKSQRPITIRSKHNIFPVADHFLNRWQYGTLFDSIVCISTAITRQLAEKSYIDENNLVTIPSAIDAHRFDTAPHIRETMRRQLGYDDTHIVIGITGRLRREKAHDVLFRAVPHVISQCPTVRFVCFGSGSLGGDLANSLQQSGMTDYVQMAGFRKDVPACLSALDIYTQPSRSEGLGTSVLEAGAAGLPIVATDCGGIPDIIRHEQTGLLVPVENEHALAKALLRMARDTDLRSRLGQAARAHVKTHFSVENLVQKTDEHYREMLQRHRHHTT